MASSMGDLNWGFLAKVFMDKLKDQKSEPEPKRRKPKRTTGTAQARPSMFMSSAPRAEPMTAIAPRDLHSSQWAAFTQFETLRMQLLRQLVVYQKQLLALRMPILPAPVAAQDPEWPGKIQNSKRKIPKVSPKTSSKSTNKLVNKKHQPNKVVRQPRLEFTNDTPEKKISKPKKVRRPRKPKRLYNESELERSQNWSEQSHPEQCSPLMHTFPTARYVKGQNNNSEYIEGKTGLRETIKPENDNLNGLHIWQKRSKQLWHEQCSPLMHTFPTAKYVKGQNNNSEYIEGEAGMRESRKPEGDDLSGLDTSQKRPEQLHHDQFSPLMHNFQTTPDVNGQSNKSALVEEKPLQGKLKGFKPFDSSYPFVKLPVSSAQDGSVCQKESYVNSEYVGVDTRAGKNINNQESGKKTIGDWLGTPICPNLVTEPEKNSPKSRTAIRKSFCRHSKIRKFKMDTLSPTVQSGEHFITPS